MHRRYSLLQNRANYKLLEAKVSIFSGGSTWDDTVMRITSKTTKTMNLVKERRTWKRKSKVIGRFPIVRFSTPSPRDTRGLDDREFFYLPMALLSLILVERKPVVLWLIFILFISLIVIYL